MVILAGNFRQTLPITRGTPADQIDACLKICYIWDHIEIIMFKRNMIVFLTEDLTLKTFSDQLLLFSNRKSDCSIKLKSEFCKLVNSIES